MAQKRAPLENLRILVVEDDYLVARAMVESLEGAGAEVLGPIGWIDEAVAFLESYADRLDAAVLDINLHGQRSDRVADALIARSVRLIFATGYGVGVTEGRYGKVPRFEKPFNLSAVIAALTPGRPEAPAG